MRTLFLSLALLLSMAVAAQNAPTCIMGTCEATSPGQLIYVPVYVSSFSGIQAISLSLFYDPMVVKYIRYDDVAGLDLLVGDSTVNNGLKNISGYWNGETKSHTEGVLLTLVFRYLQGQCQLTWNNNGTACQWYDGANVLLETSQTYVNGFVAAVVQIGGQKWMKYNMNVGIKSATQENNSKIEKFCYGGNDANCMQYGGLYQWAEAVQYQGGVTNSSHWSITPPMVQGICPDGWHIPSQDEFKTLISGIGGDLKAGGAMKLTGTTYWQGTYGGMGMKMNTGATNSSGFSGMPSGWWNYLKNKYENLQSSMNLWTVTKGQRDNAAYWYGASYNGAQVVYGQNDKQLGYAVRCVANTSVVNPGGDPTPEYGNFPALFAPKMTTTTASIVVPVTVKNFKNITTGELYFDFNPNYLAVGSITMNISHTGLSYTLSSAKAYVKFTCASPITLTDNTVLFTITFTRQATGVSVLAWEPECTWNGVSAPETNYIDGTINIQ